MAAASWVAAPESFPYYTGDLAKLANVRTIDYLRAAGVIAHSMSYFELGANHYPSATIDALVAEEGAMTTIHSAPHLSLTHGGLADPTAPGVDRGRAPVHAGVPGPPDHAGVPGMPGHANGGGLPQGAA